MRRSWWLAVLLGGSGLASALPVQGPLAGTRAQPWGTAPLAFVQDPVPLPLSPGGIALAEAYAGVRRQLAAAKTDQGRFDAALRALEKWDGDVRRQGYTSLFRDERAAAWALAAAGLTNAAQTLARRCVEDHELTVLDDLYKYAYWALKDPQFNGYFKKETQARIRAEAEACGTFELRMTSSLGVTYPADEYNLTDDDASAEVHAAVTFTLPVLPEQTPAPWGAAPVDYGFYRTAFGEGCARSVAFDLSDLQLIRFERPELMALTKQGARLDWDLTIDTGEPTEHVEAECADGSHGTSWMSFWAGLFAFFHKDEQSAGPLAGEHRFTLSTWQPGENGAFLQAKYRRSGAYPSAAIGHAEEDTTFSVVHTPRPLPSASGS
ncbi:hypothetical protein [Deinococcus sonorensis]|uniref:Uncharacterized protein n=2 Tax=Deinococcus sonorensis TaxID=309891 RepID=A0AAU7UCF4_9DEIO